MNGNTGVVSGVRVSHETASLDELAAASAASTQAALDALLEQPPVEEAFVLQTCHRVEAYVVTADQASGRRALGTAGFDPAGAGAVSMGHEQSLRHLLRVAAGLESLVVGEDQILGQLRDAYDTAKDAGGIDRVLREAVTKAMHVGERARTETAINEGATSLGTAAVRLAKRKTDLEDARALVVGAGEMGALAAKAFASADVAEVVVANRTPERADRVADSVDAPTETTDLADARGRLGAADVVVTATSSPEHVFPGQAFSDAGETVVVDLAQPRDVAPAAGTHDAVSIHDLDDLEAVTAATRERREDAAREVEAMITEEFEHLLAQYKRKRADEVIARMYESADRLKGREVQTAVQRLEAERGEDLDDAEREVVESMADALVSQLLAAPTRSLRDAAAEDDWSTIATALELFNPDFEDEMPFEVPGGDVAPAESED
ncbi:glutamyl-tRNA reductase [Halobacterium jilantaiense]|uniref:Glutamyl-tRNA reductase n=1 Tax=Halobacterium jilantaiense TaxID=355548 RepID=A0A1I0QF08_9EURY|nr:glutamyl-tRNA reductase [Halobacterium jilantaiense]SEW25542.1 glutamyl-tRNA reductase [Halobacterium jilantaiense]